MILGLVEHERGKLAEASREMLTLGRRLAGRGGLPLHAVLVGRDAEPLAAGLAAHGVSVAHIIDHERLTDYAPAAWAEGLVGLIGALQPQALMAPGTERGNEVLAHVGARTGLAMAANCLEVEPGDPYLVTRQRWGGSLLEEARLYGAVKLLTVALHAIAVEEVPVAGEVTLDRVTPALTDAALRVRVTRRVEAARDRIALGDARVVVGGGRGVGSAEGFGVLEELARLLGGAVGVSRAVTSLGWRPHADQVGQTGTRIAPELYIACGVSGAIQHMVGCKGAKHILAVNTDPDAPIVARADHAVIGDLHKVVPAVSAEIRKLRGG